MGAITGFMALEMRGQNSESLSATNINLINVVVVTLDLVDTTISTLLNKFFSPD